MIFESDCIYTDTSIDRIIQSSKIANSHWYSIGRFKQNQNGGILTSNNQDLINDLRIVPRYENHFVSYNKLIGILHVHRGNSELYFELLEKEVKKDTLNLMKNIKSQFDPKNILNPNKSI